MFEWPVAADGYYWVSNADSEENKLDLDSIQKDRHGSWHGCHLDANTRVFRWYHPLQDPGLFLTFAETPVTPKGMLEFANQYGHLGSHIAPDDPDTIPNFDSAEEKERYVQTKMRRYDPIYIWQKSITEMRRWIKQWDHLAKDSSRLKSFFGDINSKLAHDACRVIFLPNRRSHGGYSHSIKPTSLLAALWFQLGEAVACNKKFEKCVTCAKWFEIAPPFVRNSRQYCSEACRSRAYRERREKAINLAADGKSASEIAGILGSDEASVKGWINLKEK